VTGARQVRKTVGATEAVRVGFGCLSFFFLNFFFFTIYIW
jgi:hypothetical protein